MALIQRFGSADNLNILLHRSVLDRVHRRGADGVAYPLAQVLPRLAVGPVVGLVLLCPVVRAGR